MHTQGRPGLPQLATITRALDPSSVVYTNQSNKADASMASGLRLSSCDDASWQIGQRGSHFRQPAARSEFRHWSLECIKHDIHRLEGLDRHKEREREREGAAVDASHPPTGVSSNVLAQAFGHPGPVEGGWLCKPLSWRMQRVKKAVNPLVDVRSTAPCFLLLHFLHQSRQKGAVHLFPTCPTMVSGDLVLGA